MGFSSSGGIFINRTLKIIEDLPGTQAMVDDIIVSSDSFTQLIERLFIIFQKLEQNKATISIKKFEVGREIEMAGINVTCSDTGVELRPAKEALNAFSRLKSPTSKRELQSFLGMLNIFHSWDIEISASSTHLRTLLQKGAVWKCDMYYEQELTKIKQIISSLDFLAAFNVHLKTNLFVDTSREGIGYVLTQEKPEGKISVIKCGSVGLAPAPSHYSPTELEPLGISWSVRDNRIYLMGLKKVQVYTDHRPCRD